MPVPAARETVVQAALPENGNTAQEAKAPKKKKKKSKPAVESSATAAAEVVNRSIGAAATASDTTKQPKAKQTKAKDTPVTNGSQARSMPKAPSTVEAVSLQVSLHSWHPCKARVVE